MEGIGPFIRKRRDEVDLWFRELAKKLDCSLAFISDIELGRRHPSDKLLIEIAKILKVKSEELRKMDVRPPIEEIKRVTEDDPTFALAFRDALTGRRVLEHLSGSGLLQTTATFLVSEASGILAGYQPSCEKVRE